MGKALCESVRKTQRAGIQVKFPCPSGKYKKVTDAPTTYLKLKEVYKKSKNNKAAIFDKLPILCWKVILSTKEGVSSLRRCILRSPNLVLERGTCTHHSRSARLYQYKKKVINSIRITTEASPYMNHGKGTCQGPRGTNTYVRYGWTFESTHEVFPTFHFQIYLKIRSFNRSSLFDNAIYVFLLIV
ncbi:hypothetical protein EDEG_03944 [Edhazardia aedis USNM 41457]|uniref:Uncharacterized protein n=1 Tax=Edhazardia aedis (strain USNM 41457) TaxID=1003232 RepID=J8ZP36_EDHAE|nr:hypothetical protein EDEG_03944 [Edhazardia aedis USNM 41457]|eukprot:EJW01468.1 hypothetical protein EDEG_03944 [Edhazardia aedis USNM 41457]